MRTTREDSLRARAMGVALDDQDASEEGELTAMTSSRNKWEEAFFLMRASREKWRRRWWITMGGLMGIVVAFMLCAVLALLSGRASL